MEPIFSPKDLKHYPHFDRRLSIKEAEEIVSDPARVAANKFYPFFLYEETWQPFRIAEKERPEPKSRPIRYAARRDAYILTHYRRILAERYEERLSNLGVEHCPIAYRKIPKGGGGGKCNIDFAKDAFDEIEKQGDCVAIALDIKGYFENLDHERIKAVWCDLLAVDRLPPDHFTVFKNVTRYHVVDQKDVYRRLGYIETVSVNGYPRERYTVPFKKMPTQLCSPADFRAKICGGDPTIPSLVRRNADEEGNLLNHGVPQGAPISDLIANFYLLGFDVAMNQYAESRGGRYMRYSDDILLIVPGGETEADEAEAFAVGEIRKYGEELQIKEAKTCIVRFLRDNDALAFQHVRGPQGKNGFEYLGFRFDGRQVYVRDSTISRLYRKVALSAKGVARGFAKAHPKMNASEILATFNYSDFSQRFSRVHPEELSPDDYGTWTFYSYLKRASETFGARGAPILPQARNFKAIMKQRIAEAMVRAVVQRDKAAAAATEAEAE
ncbi:reverse transcriptase domain-containing protein [Ruegeria sp. A3M17]|uniref:reverse transcriptase domain-containing protein n=1 Tax=Ruegeria sp. A3M17 TaxID=2267229 RepID=UPI00131441ED|nr:reverse transcriptase domain-containing protein [Ruegeria sp. A3M17]